MYALLASLPIGLVIAAMAIFSPRNVIAGAAAVDLACGREGEVLRAIAIVCILYAASWGS